MRFVAVFLILGAGAAWLLLELTREPELPARHGKSPGAVPEPAAAPLAALEIVDGVAVAPDFGEEESDAPPAAPEERHFWAGRAISDSLKRGVESATVVLESVLTGESWAQAPTRAGGYFIARAPPTARKAEPLRVVIETEDKEIGIRPATIGKETWLGTVRLTGRAALKGRAEDERSDPAKDVRVTVRRFGELEILPGELASATSDEHGEFTLEPLPHGSFVLEGIGPDGRRYLARPVFVPRYEPVVLAPLPGATLELELFDTLHDPVGYALVEALPRGADPEKDPLDPALFLSAFTATTDAEGRARIEHLRPGLYHLLFTLDDGSAFEFSHDHVAGAKRKLRVPVDRELRLFFFEAPPDPPKDAVGRAAVRRAMPRDPPPLANTKLHLDVEGTTSQPGRVYVRTLTRTTDEDGVAAVPRLGSLRTRVVATAPDVQRRGKVTVALASVKEGARAGWVPMPPYVPAEEKERIEKATATLRHVRVTLPDGTPVKGAYVFLKGNRRQKTDENGEAALGRATDEKIVYLRRPDLASGDPHDGEVGKRTRVDLTWNEGREILLRVVDAADGFPIGGRLRIEPRRPAWELVEPGVYRTRWDADYAGDEVRIVVRVDGYEPWQADPPTGPGPRVEYEARLLRPLVLATTLQIEAVGKNVPVPGAWTTGRFAGNWKPELGKAAFRALTGPGGRVVLTGLAEGPWLLRADAGARGWTQRQYALARGFNPVTLHLDRGATVKGTTVDDRGRPIEGVRIEVQKPADRRQRGVAMPTAYSDKKGRFRLNLPVPRAHFVAEKPGYRRQAVEVRAGLAQPVEIKLPRLGAIDLPVVWRDGRRDPVPRDIELEISYRYERWMWSTARVTARVEDGRLRAEAVPPGRLRLRQLRGSAWTRTFQIRVPPGATVKSPKIPLSDGGTVEGKVTDGTKPMPAHLVFVTPAWGTPRPARTNEQGEFRVTGLPPGKCTVYADGETRESRAKNRRVGVSDGAISKVAVIVR